MVLKFNQCKEKRAIDACPLDWEKFKEAFLYCFPLEMRETNVLEFINHHQGNMSVKLTQLDNYTSTMVTEYREI